MQNKIQSLPGLPTFICLDVILLSFMSHCYSQNHHQMPLYASLFALSTPIRTKVAPGWPSGGRCGFLFSLLFQLRRLRAQFSHVCFNGYRTVSTSHLREGAVRAARRGLIAENKVTSAVQYCSRLRAKKLLRTDVLWIPKKDGGEEIKSYYPEYMKRGYTQAPFCCIPCVVYIFFLI